MTLPGFLTIDRITHRASILARVDDGTQPVPSATVTITNGPPAWLKRPRKRTEITTDANGVASWFDLPPGTYTLTAHLDDPRYTDATAAAVVAATYATVSLTLAVTAVTGVVTDGTSPLAMALVRVADSGEVAYTDADGKFALSPVEPGARTLEISAQRYTPTRVAVALAAGASTAAPPIQLTLTPS